MALCYDVTQLQVKCVAGYFCTGGAESATPQSEAPDAANGKCPKVRESLYFHTSVYYTMSLDIFNLD